MDRRSNCRSPVDTVICAPKLIVRFVTAVPVGTPFKSAAVLNALLKYAMLRALVTLRPTWCPPLRPC